MSYVKRHLILTRTVEEAFWTLWRHHYDATLSRDVTSSLTSPFDSLGHFSIDPH